jgi:diguanylate cyclase (GGDEF)-like protein/PAS domain S-box-containing protein
MAQAQLTRTQYAGDTVLLNGRQAKAGAEVAPRPSVLLVDDRTDNLESLEAILEDGETVLLKATSGEQALHLLLVRDVSLVLLDVQMPGMNGYDVARLMRSNRKTRAIPIIFITAIMRDEAAAIRGYEAGAIDYIMKPVSPAILRSKVAMFLEYDQNKRGLQQAYKKLDNTRAYYESILRAAGDGVMGVAQDGTVLFANPAALHALGRTSADLIGQHFKLFYPERADGTRGDASSLMLGCWNTRDKHRVEEDYFVRADGQSFPVTYSCSPVAGQFDGSVLIFQDITLRKALENKLRQQVITDALTGLYNRNGFKEAFQISIDRARRNRKRVALMFIDLDFFKRINDTLGHDVGDDLLQAVAIRLRESVRSYDVVSRIGGDEFTVILDEINDDGGAAIVADKILFALRRPFSVNGAIDLTVGASIGIAMYPECGADTDVLMQAADVAMYQAKGKGRNLYQFYLPEMNARARARLILEQSLRGAVEHDQFELYYQPQVNLANGRVVGFEALLRWERQNDENVMPGTFVPMLEETGLIVPMGDWVFSAGCRQRQEWSSLLADDCTVAVNLSSRQFTDKNLISAIHRALDSVGLPPHQLEIELTESMLMLNTEYTHGVLRAMKNMGLRLAIDDFGTGYSSLAYLKHFALDFLKIDKHFIENLTTSTKDAAITTSIIQLGHNLGLGVIAEGVETVEQMNLLQELGCDYVQGYYFGRPLPAHEVGGFPRTMSLN